MLSRQRWIVLFIVFAALGSTTGARAGTIAVGQDYAAYEALALNYPMIGRLAGTGGTCSGTLIQPAWMLTAAHCVHDDTTDFAVFGSTTYSVTEQHTYPDYIHNSESALYAGFDIALVKLDQTPTGIAPAVLYGGSDELSKTATYTGFGRMGDGDTGDTIFNSGTALAGNNVIDGVGATTYEYGDPDIVFSTRLLLADFDDGSAPNNALGFSEPGWSISTTSDASPLPLEYMVGSGDSGGGVFLDIGGQARLAGVNSFGVGFFGPADSTYGTVSASVRVSHYNGWIASVIPEPGTGVLLALGLMGLGFRQRR